MSDPERCKAEQFKLHWKHLERHHFKPFGPYEPPESMDDLKELLYDAFHEGFEVGTVWEANNAPEIDDGMP